MWEKLANIDRRVIYVLMIVVVALALLNPVGMAIVPSEETKRAYDFIESLPPGSVIYLGMDFDASAMPELMPALQAVIRQGFRKDLRFIAGGMWVQAGDMADAGFSIVEEEFPDKQYGVDWVNLGYKPGGEVLLQKMLVSFYDACAGVDHYGNNLNDLPLINEIKTIKDVDAIFTFVGGTPGEREYIRHITSPYNIPFLISCMSVTTPEMMPLIQSRQVLAGVLGMKGAAEYEVLIGHPGTATAGMDAQSCSHALIIVFIIVGNLGYIFTRKEEEK